MERTLLFTVYFLISYICNAQQINWARGTYSDVPSGTPSRGLICDNQGYLYNYGSRDFGPWINNNEGSFLTKYSTNGQLLSSKFWPFPFAIKKMVYDGAAHFYVVGSVAQATVLNSILVPNRGGSDGFIGKMDLSGNFEWIKTFGASGTDDCNGITFNTAKNKLIVTGGIKDSLYMNSTFISMNTDPTMLLACFDLAGNLISHKLVDFEPSLSDPNCGKEIMADNAGNFLVFGNREGKYWYNDTSTLADEGNYVFKFNYNFDLSWSKFVINGSCYYGYNCGNMNVDNNGNTYVSSYCSSKYGGSGCIKKFDPSGVLTWSLNVKDANGYIATPVNNNLFITGEEGASIYPGPGSHSGYQVIKKLDHTNSVVGETRMQNVHITKPAAYYNGVFYVTGTFYSDAPIIGKDTLKSNYTAGSFIAQLSDVNCEPVIADSLEGPFYTSKNFCPQNSVVLNAGPGYSEYLWCNGITTQTMQTNLGGNYYVRVTQSSGCKAYSLPITLNSLKPEKMEVGKVTYDNASGRNKLFWNYYSYSEAGTQYLKLYKLSGSDTAVIAVSQASASSVSDSLSYLDHEQVGYYITRIDTCGSESEPGIIHRPVFLTSNANMLHWTNYHTFAHQNFHLFRGTTKENMLPFVVVPWGTNSYSIGTDTNYYYQVMIHLSSSWEFNTFSNITKGSALSVGVIANKSNSSSLDIYPNPSTGIFNMNIISQNATGQMKIRISNVMGGIVQTKTLELNTNEMNTSIDMNGNSPGVYFVGIEIPGMPTVQKRIVLK